MVRVLIGGADCARAGARIALSGFPNVFKGAYSPLDVGVDVRDGDEASTRAVSRCVVDADGAAVGDGNAAVSTSFTPDGEFGVIAINAVVTGEACGGVARAILEFLREKGPIDEACFACAARDEALEARSSGGGCVVYEDVRNDATPSESENIVVRCADGLGVKDGVLTTVWHALTCAGVKTRAVYAHAFSTRRNDPEAEQGAIAVARAIGRAIETSAFGLRGFDGDAVGRLRTASDANPKDYVASLYM